MREHKNTVNITSIRGPDTPAIEDFGMASEVECAAQAYGKCVLTSHLEQVKASLPRSDCGIGAPNGVGHLDFQAFAHYSRQTTHSQGQKRKSIRP